MKLLCLGNDNHGSAIGFIIGMLVIGLVVAGIVGSFAYQIGQAQVNGSVAGTGGINTSGGAYEAGEANNVANSGIPGGVAMLGILALLFIVVPVIIFARSAK